MNRGISISGWKDGFGDGGGIAVVFDIFRCSTTIHTLIGRNRGPVMVAPSLAMAATNPKLKQWRVFSELSQPVQCLERFDNSPHQAFTHPWPIHETALVSTTTGTPAMFAAQGFDRVLVGSLVGFSALVKHLSQVESSVTLIPAALGKDQVEDGIVAQAVATALDGYSSLPEFVKQCGQRAVEEIIASGRPKVLEERLPTGREDMRHCLNLDRDSFLLRLDFEENSGLAKVELLDTIKGAHS